MAISITSEARERLRTELLKHRSRFDLTDLAYVQDVLKISLNTYKKCVSPGTGTLVLSRNTFRNIVRHATLNPEEFGVASHSRNSDAQLGAYVSSDYDFMCQRFALYRRSFLHARNLNRSVLDIWIDQERGCLRFCETENYVSDLGLPHEQKHVGDISIDRDRSILSLLGNHAGRVRLMLLVIPQHVIGNEGLRMRGALLTHGRPRGYWQPTTASLYIEEFTGPAPQPGTDTGPGSGTLGPDWPDYDRISNEIRAVEDYTTVDTALISRAAPAPA